MRGLDDLPQGLEEPGPGPLFLAFPGRAQQLNPGLVHGLLEVRTEIVFVADEGLAVPVGLEPVHGRGAGQNIEEDLAFIRLGPGQCVPDREPVQGGDQVQAQPAKVARMRRAVPIFGPPGQIRTAGSFSGSAAFHGCGVNDPHIIAADVVAFNEVTNELFSCSL